MDPAHVAAADRVYYGGPEVEAAGETLTFDYTPVDAKGEKVAAKVSFDANVKVIGAGAQARKNKIDHMYDMYEKLSDPKTQVEDTQAPVATINSIEGLARKLSRRGVPTSATQAQVYLEGQDVYQRNRVLENPRVLQTIKATAPGQVFQADTIEMLNTKDATAAAIADRNGSNLGVNKVLTCIDVFTRVVFAVPIDYDYHSYDPAANDVNRVTMQKAVGKAADVLILMIFDYYNELLRRGCCQQYLDTLGQYVPLTTEELSLLGRSDVPASVLNVSRVKYCDRNPNSPTYGQYYAKQKYRADDNVPLLQPVKRLEKHWIYRQENVVWDGSTDGSKRPYEGWRQDRTRPLSEEGMMGYGYYKGPLFIQTDRGAEFGYTGENLQAVYQRGTEAWHNDAMDADDDATDSRQWQSHTGRYGWRDRICLVPEKYALDAKGKRSEKLYGINFQRKVVGEGGGYEKTPPSTRDPPWRTCYRHPHKLCMAGRKGTPWAQAYIESWHKTMRARLRIQFDMDRPGALIPGNAPGFKDAQRLGQPGTYFTDAQGRPDKENSPGQSEVLNNIPYAGTGGAQSLSSATVEGIDAARGPPGQAVDALEAVGVDTGLTPDERLPYAPTKATAAAMESSALVKQRWAQDAASGKIYNVNSGVMVPQSATKVALRQWLWILPFIVKEYNSTYHSRLKGVPDSIDFRNFEGFKVFHKGEQPDWVARLTDDGVGNIKWQLNQKNFKDTPKISTAKLKKGTVVRLQTASDLNSVKKMHGHFAPTFANMNPKGLAGVRTADGKEWPMSGLHEISEVQQGRIGNPKFKLRPVGGGSSSTEFVTPATISVVAKRKGTATARAKGPSVRLNYGGGRNYA